MFEIDTDLIYIIFVTIACWIWAYIVSDEFFNMFLRYIERKNKEKQND